jgi:pimeloyl-ACP methyl ester carboxylesterase
MKKPVVYQMNNGVRREIQAMYLLEGDLLAFQIGGYDTTRPLIIDPVLIYSRILGGSGDDNAVGIAVDGAGAVYLVGQSMGATGCWNLAARYPHLFTGLVAVSGNADYHAWEQRWGWVSVPSTTHGYLRSFLRASGHRAEQRPHVP